MHLPLFFRSITSVYDSVQRLFHFKTTLIPDADADVFRRDEAALLVYVPLITDI